jgi:chemotaxis family two-component system response regulator PixG
MINELCKEINEHIKKSETGCLKIKNLKQPETSWSLYFVLGRLSWANGGDHSLRRLYRHLKQEISKPMQQEVTPKETVSVEYNWLGTLFRNDLLSIKQVVEIKRKIKVEVLFDLFQIFHFQGEVGSKSGENTELSWEWFPNVRTDNYIHIPPDLANSSQEVMTMAQQQWKKWEQAGLKECLPNQAPMMTDAESIKQATAAQTFEKLKQLLTGKQTLRDIAVETKRDVLSVTQALWGFYKKGWLEFKDIPDLDWETLTQGSYCSINPSRSSQNSQKKFLVACVDDSPQVTQTMEEILRSGGYDCISINDPLRASATLLKVKPDLIFLDLIMPNTNGYEICSKLRKVSSFRETPIIILTGKDGLIDRMRAKMVGANEYISKPVQRSMILRTAQDYLLNPSAVSTEIAS